MHSLILDCGSLTSDFSRQLQITLNSYSIPSRSFDPGLFKTFVSLLLSYTLCSNVCAILMASVGQATMQRLHRVHSSRWYTKVSSAFFFFPSGVTSNLVMILIVAFGQANSQAVHPVHACSLFSSWGITTSPRKRSGKTNSSRLSGYCWVIFSFLCCKA